MAFGKSKAAEQTAPVESYPVQDEPVDLSTTGSTEVGFPIDYSVDAGQGLEQLGAGDLSLPFITVIQKLSPIVDETKKDKYNPEARPGMLLNTLTGDLYRGDSGLSVIPCGYQKIAVEWKPRDSGGGLVGHHPLNDELVQKASRNEKNQLVLPGGNIIVETAYHFVLLMVDGQAPMQAVISMSSTQLKKSRRWNTIMSAMRMRKPNGTTFQPPMFAHVYRITTVPESNAQGNWYGFNIEKEGQVQDREIYDMAREFAKSVSAGTVKVSAPPVDSDHAEMGEDSAF